MSKTNIQVSREVRDALASLGKKGDSYDDILHRILEGGVYNSDNIFKTSVPFKSENGILHMDVIIPKCTAIEVPDVDFVSAVRGVIEDNDLEELDDGDFDGVD